AGVGCGGEVAETAAPAASATPATIELDLSSIPPAPATVLHDEARARGLGHVNRSGSGAKEVILEANGGGVALLDLGGDGDLDVVFSQGLSGVDALFDGPGADIEVFLNDGGG